MNGDSALLELPPLPPLKEVSSDLDAATKPAEDLPLIKQSDVLSPPVSIGPDEPLPKLDDPHKFQNEKFSTEARAADLTDEDIDRWMEHQRQNSSDPTDRWLASKRDEIKAKLKPQDVVGYDPDLAYEMWNESRDPIIPRTFGEGLSRMWTGATLPYHIIAGAMRGLAAIPPVGSALIRNFYNLTGGMETDDPASQKAAQGAIENFKGAGISFLGDATHLISGFNSNVLDAAIRSGIKNQDDPFTKEQALVNINAMREAEKAHEQIGKSDIGGAAVSATQSLLGSISPQAAETIKNKAGGFTPDELKEMGYSPDDAEKLSMLPWFAIPVGKFIPESMIAPLTGAALKASALPFSAVENTFGSPAINRLFYHTPLFYGMYAMSHGNFEPMAIALGIKMAGPQVARAMQFTSDMAGSAADFLKETGVRATLDPYEKAILAGLEAKAKPSGLAQAATTGLTKATGGAIRGGLQMAPFTAGSQSPQEAAEQIGFGMGIGGAHDLSAGLVLGARKVGLDTLLKIPNGNYIPLSKDSFQYGIPELDSLHEQETKGWKKENIDLLNQGRHLLQDSTKIFTMSPDKFDSTFGHNAHGVQFEQADGQYIVFRGEQGFENAKLHEPIHVIRDEHLTASERALIDQTLEDRNDLSSFASDHFSRLYGQPVTVDFNALPDRVAVKGPKNPYGLTKEMVRSELMAEALKTLDISKITDDPNLKRKIQAGIGKMMEQLGIPTTTTEASTINGITPSLTAFSVVENAMRRMATKSAAEGVTYGKTPPPPVSPPTEPTVAPQPQFPLALPAPDPAIHFPTVVAALRSLGNNATDAKAKAEDAINDAREKNLPVTPEMLTIRALSGRFPVEPQVPRSRRTSRPTATAPEPPLPPAAAVSGPVSPPAAVPTQEPIGIADALAEIQRRNAPASPSAAQPTEAAAGPPNEAVAAPVNQEAIDKSVDQAAKTIPVPPPQEVIDQYRQRIAKIRQSMEQRGQIPPKIEGGNIGYKRQFMPSEREPSDKITSQAIRVGGMIFKGGTWKEAKQAAIDYGFTPEDKIERGYVTKKGPFVTQDEGASLGIERGQFKEEDVPGTLRAGTFKGKRQFMPQGDTELDQLGNGLTPEEHKRYLAIKANPEPTTQEADEFSKLIDKINAHTESEGEHRRSSQPIARISVAEFAKHSITATGHKLKQLLQSVETDDPIAKSRIQRVIENIDKPGPEVNVGRYVNSLIAYSELKGKPAEELRDASANYELAKQAVKEINAPPKPKIPDRFYHAGDGRIIDRLTGKWHTLAFEDDDVGDMVDQLNNENQPLPNNWTRSDPKNNMPEGVIENKDGTFSLIMTDETRHGKFDTREEAEKGLTPPDVPQLQDKSMIQTSNAQVSSEPRIQFMPAHHGTPHDVTKFSLEKVGSGEGSQAFGYGLYFAENPKTAKFYQDQLKPMSELQNVRIAGVQLYRNGTPEDYSPHQFLKGNEQPSDSDHARASLQEDALIEEWKLREAFDKDGEPGLKKAFGEILDRKLQMAKEEWPEALPYLESVKTKFDNNIGDRIAVQKGESHLYTVDLDVEPHELLDHDAPLSKQPDKVKDIVREKLKEKKYLSQKDDGKIQLTRAWKAYINEHGGMSDADSGHTIYDKLLDGDSDPKAASELLNSKGIKGIQYYDAVSRERGRGSRNYVMFDDSRITITHKNGEEFRPSEMKQFMPKSEAKTPTPTKTTKPTIPVAAPQKKKKKEQFTKRYSAFAEMP